MALIITTDGEVKLIDRNKILHRESISGVAIVGMGTVTDNALIRANGTTGSVLQDSGIIVDDSDNMTAVESITMTSGTSSISGNDATGRGRNPARARGLRCVRDKKRPRQ